MVLSVLIHFSYLNVIRKRNYVFTLAGQAAKDPANEEQDGGSEIQFLDAVGLSNETRFPNHGGRLDMDNCKAAGESFRLTLFGIEM